MKKHLLLPILLNLLLTFISSSPLQAQCNSTPCTVPTPSLNAQDACILPNPGSLDCYFGATTTDAPVSFPPSWCVTIENNHFFAFTADAPTASFQICTYGCSSGSGIQAAILSTSDCINFAFESACLGNILEGTCEQLVTSSLIPGQVYYLMIDGNAGSLCDYSINGVDPSISGQTSGLCIPGPSTTYTTSTPSSWSINPPTAGSIQGDTVGTSVNILWAEGGPAQVCAKSLNCSNAPDYCLHVFIAENVQHNDTVSLCENYTVDCAGQTYSAPGNYTVTLPSYLGCDSTVHCVVNLIPTVSTTQTVQMCPGGSAFCGGKEFISPGNFIVTLTTLNGCDSLVHCLVNIIPNNYKDLGPQFVCQGSCFQLGDSTYCQPGSYTQIFKSYQGCDSIISFKLVVIAIQNSAAIQTPQGKTITCLHPSLLLESPNLPFVSHIWKNIGGNILGTGNSITVSTPGIYFHETKGTLAGTNCSEQAKILIKENTTPPPVTAMGGTLDAQHPTVQLMGNSINTSVTYHWEGPNGFSSSQKKPIVSVPGFYTLTITDPLTGCTNSITVEVIVMV